MNETSDLRTVIKALLAKKKTSKPNEIEDNLRTRHWSNDQLRWLIRQLASLPDKEASEAEQEKSGKATTVERGRVNW